jgi:hypothetical protein
LNACDYSNLYRENSLNGKINRSAIQHLIKEKSSNSNRKPMSSSSFISSNMAADQANIYNYDLTTRQQVVNRDLLSKKKTSMSLNELNRYKGYVEIGSALFQTNINEFHKEAALLLLFDDSINMNYEIDDNLNNQSSICIKLNRKRFNSF